MRKLSNNDNRTPGSKKRGRPAKKSEVPEDEEVEETPSKKTKRTRLADGRKEADDAERGGAEVSLVGKDQN